MSSTFSAQLSVVSVREDFTKGMSNLMTDRRRSLVARRHEREVAMLLALQDAP